MGGWWVSWMVGRWMGWCAAKMAAIHVVATERDPPGVMVGGSAGRLAPPRAGELGFCETGGHLLLLATRDAKMDGNGAPSRNRRADAGELGVRFRLAQPKVFGGIEKRVDGLYRHASVQFK